MKIVIAFLICLSILVNPLICSSQSNKYYVTQSGSGSNNGESLANAMSISKFNSLTGDYSNKTFFFSGKITSQIIPRINGNSSGHAIIDGLEAGSCNPIENFGCSGAAAITGGLSMANNSRSYLTFQDFNSTGGLWNFTTNVTSPCTNIKILRNNFYDANLAHLVVGVSDYSAHTGPSYFWIEGNRFHNYGKATNAEGAIMISKMSDLVFRGNSFTGNNGVSVSSNLINFHQTTNTLFEYNYSNTVVNQGNTKTLSYKEWGNTNAIVRFNKFFGCAERSIGINWPTTSNVFVYGNLIDGNNLSEYAIDVYDGAKNVNIWSNIIVNHTNAGIVTWFAEGRQHGYDPPHHVTNLKIYNNTISKNASGDSLSRSAISLTDGSGKGNIIKNNLFVNNRHSEADRRQMYNATGTNASFEQNTYFHSGGAPTVHHINDHRTIPTLQSSFQREDDSPAGIVANPGLNTNMTLNGSHVNNGGNLSGTVGSVTVHGTTYTMTWETALHPSTDWSGQPSATKIITGNQNSYGSGWERGAYVYDTDNKQIIPPSSVFIEPYL